MCQWFVLTGTIEFYFLLFNIFSLFTHRNTLVLGFGRFVVGHSVSLSISHLIAVARSHIGEDYGLSCDFLLLWFCVFVVDVVDGWICTSNTIHVKGVTSIAIH